MAVLTEDSCVRISIRAGGGRARANGTHRDVGAVDQDLQHRLVLVGIHGGQVVQGAGDGPVNPLCEFTGQVFGAAVLELPFQDVCEKLQTHNRTHI